MISFRKTHILKILDSFSQVNLPLDIFLSHYFRSKKSIGAKDRKEIADTVYGIIRLRGLLDHLSETPLTWENRYKRFIKGNFFSSHLSAHIQVSFPKFLFDLLSSALGEEKAKEFCLLCNEPAPTTIRVNILKISRDELLKKWESKYEVERCRYSDVGITFKKKVNFFSLPEFKEGLFEIQDEGSQLVANLLEIKPHHKVLDYCAGSGGKTLAFAHKLQNRGQIFLHDIRPSILLEAKKRLKRAGIQNAQIVLPDEMDQKGLNNKMNIVLLDVPCSGTGTLRRNPDLKWKLKESSIIQLVEEQRKIFDKAVKFLKPSAKIYYITCSVLPQENEEQVDYFIKNYPVTLDKPLFQTFVSQGGMDSFFCASLSQK